MKKEGKIFTNRYCNGHYTDSNEEFSSVIYHKTQELIERIGEEKATNMIIDWYEESNKFPYVEKSIFIMNKLFAELKLVDIYIRLRYRDDEEGRIKDQIPAYYLDEPQKIIEFLDSKYGKNMYISYEIF